MLCVTYKVSGHSKWSTIKRAKGVTDAKRSAMFSKIAKLILIAAKQGGDPNTNFSLRMAIEKARSVNMPRDNIERAIKKGSGELGGDKMEELIYEGFGSAETQFIVKCLTDNKNRTASQVRHIFNKNGGSFGSVMWNFAQKGIITITNDELRITNDNLDEFELELIDVGIEDMDKHNEGIVLYTKIENLQKVENFLKEKGIQIESSEIGYVASQKKEINELEQEKVEKFIDDLEENEDVSDYYNNIA